MPLQIKRSAGGRTSISDLLSAMAMSRSAFSCKSAFLLRSCSRRTLSAATHASCASSLSFRGTFVDEYGDRLFNVGLLLLGENFKSSSHTEHDLLLLSAAVAAAKGSMFQAELENELSVKSLVILSDDGNGAKGSLSGANGSKLSFVFKPFIDAPEAGTAKGSSVCDAKGSSNPMSLKGSSVNSSSA